MYLNIMKLILGLIVLSSCNTQNLFRTSNSGSISDLINGDENYHHVIQKDDKISLSIWNHDDMSVGSVFSIYNSNEAYGKWILVDEHGQVVLPKIGTYAIGGLTCPSAADSLKNRYAKFLVDPVIVVKVLNREVTLLGELRTPGTYILEKEKNTITEVLGMAEGFANYADLAKVQVIRNGVSYNLDLTKLDESLLHNIVIESGDIIHVPSKRGKSLDQKAPTLIPFSSSLTAIAVVISILL